VIETERLLLRPWRDGDERIAAPIYAKPSVMCFIPGGVWTAEQTAQIVTRMKTLEREQGFGFYPVVHKGSGELIGHAGLGHLERTPEIELAYVLDETHWGRGYATEIAQAVLAHAFGKLGLDRVVAVAFPENHRSIRVMQRAGMRPVGIAFHFGKDVVKYEALRPT
jgi:ribosomal-protein-alanine N-acetyltransferase